MNEKIKFSVLKYSSEKIEKQIADIAKELYPKYTKAICRDCLRKILKNRYQILFVAKNNTRDVIGMLTLTIYPTIGGFSKAWIEDFAVLTKYQGLGIGKGLLEYTIKSAKKMNLNVLLLTSRSERKAANHLYKKLNFSLVQTNLYKKNLKKG